MERRYSVEIGGAQFDFMTSFIYLCFPFRFLFKSKRGKVYTKGDILRDYEIKIFLKKLELIERNSFDTLCSFLKEHLKEKAFGRFGFWRHLRSKT